MKQEVENKPKRGSQEEGRRERKLFSLQKRWPLEEELS